MRKELDYFKIEGHTGGSQDWFRDYMMKMGGCAAATACDSSIYFDLKGFTKGLYPFDPNQLTKNDYIEFSRIMKPYLRPGWRGINRLEIYIEGFNRYMAARGISRIKMKGFSGHELPNTAWNVVKSQIDAGFPIPILLLHHKVTAMDFYVWHWFILGGYNDENHTVKAITYGSAKWLDFNVLWDTGYKERGGLILYSI